MSIKGEIRRVLWKLGYDVSRFDPTSHPLARRKKLIELYAIDLVLDVGANEGQYARQLRKSLAYSGRIVSFEPLSREFKMLKRYADNDPKWEAINCALGSRDESIQINIAGNSLSSSILKMLPSHIKSAPSSKNIGEELIKVRRLDALFNDIVNPTEKVYLKLDTQGFEGEILKGARESLPLIDTIQLEMALIPLYEGETLFFDLHCFLTDNGYSLVSIEPGFSDRESTRMLQIDGIYHRFS